MLSYTREGLTFDDILIRPAYSELGSRQDPRYHVGPSEIFGIPGIAPIMAANMKTIATIEMSKALGPLGIIVPSHRFQTGEEQLAFHNETDESSGGNHIASIGLNERDRLAWLTDVQTLIMLELAHCDSWAAVEEVKWLTKEGYRVIAGNVATAEGAKRLFDAGAGMVKVGIGPGSVCTTRLVTGCGVPQLSAIMECAEVGPIIADGGIRSSGDIVKALAAGAKLVMIGSLFAGTDEARPPQSEVMKEYLGVKGGILYMGMASREAGKVSSGNIPEGVSVHVPYVGGVEAVATDLLAGVRQGMAMVGAGTLKELREKAVFQRVSPATIRENHPHIRERLCT